MIRAKTILMSVALLAVPLVAVLVAGSASAHICRAQDPARSCGQCTPNLLQPYHDHDYNNGSNYCNSIGYVCAQIASNCDIGGATIGPGTQLVRAALLP